MLNNVRAGLAVLFILLSSHALAANKLDKTNYPSCKSSAGAVNGVVGAGLCDLSFTSIPTYACGVSTQTGTYTIQNNTPVRMPISYVRLSTTANPVSASNVTIASNTCGTSLAPGASCNVVVSINTALPVSRVLQIGVNSRQAELDSPTIAQTIGCTTASTVSASFPCALNSLSNFAALAGSDITNGAIGLPNTVLNGNVGLSPGSSVTGFPPGTINGTLFVDDPTAVTAQNDLTTLASCLQMQPCPGGHTVADVSGLTLTSSGAGAVNVYCSVSTIMNSGVLTLSGDAASVFIFQAGSALTMNGPASVVLTGGLTAANVFWVNRTAATLTGAVAFQGTLLAGSSITTGAGTTILGRELAKLAVTYSGYTVSTLP